MNPKNNPAVLAASQSVSAYVTAGSLPAWEQVPPHCQQELVLALAALLLHDPDLQALLETQGP